MSTTIDFSIDSLQEHGFSSVKGFDTSVILNGKIDEEKANSELQKLSNKILKRIARVSGKRKSFFENGHANTTLMLNDFGRANGSWLLSIAVSPRGGVYVVCGEGLSKLTEDKFQKKFQSFVIPGDHYACILCIGT